MSRRHMFDREAVSEIRGLTSLTEPSSDDRVGTILDIPVIGARGDGKTQFIVHAIRTLRAYAPVLDGAEYQYNRDVMHVVMNARRPRPDATPPGVVPHYVFRIRAESLESQVGFAGRFALLARAAGLGSYWLLAAINSAAVAAVLVLLRATVDPQLVLAATGVFVAGAVLGVAFARRRLWALGEIEIVFWDVAGEHVYSDSSVDYYTFLSALVRERQRRASSSRSYAFAPVLVCNPLALGVHAETSAYSRLRQLIPLFASLAGPTPRALVAINRWTAVKAVCSPDSDRDEIIAVVPRARQYDDESDVLKGTEASDFEDASEASDFEDASEASDFEDPSEVHGDSDPADASEVAPTSRLPLVKRDVLRRLCLDAEDERNDEVQFSYLRYDAGSQCEFSQQPWRGYHSLAASVRNRWRAPTAGLPDGVLNYGYEEGPRSFEGSTRRDFLRWLSGMSYCVHDETSVADMNAIAGREQAEEGVLGAPAPESDQESSWTGTPAAAAAIRDNVGVEHDASAWSGAGDDAWRPHGFAAERTAGAMERIWTGPASASPWREEGTAPGIGPGGRTPTPASPEESPSVSMSAADEDDGCEDAEDDDPSAVHAGGFRRGT